MIIVIIIIFVFLNFNSHHHYRFCDHHFVFIFILIIVINILLYLSLSNRHHHLNFNSHYHYLVRFDFVTLHTRHVALCSKLSESITSCPDHKLVPVLPPKREHRYNLRQSRAYAMPRTRTNRFKNTLIPSMCA